MPKLSQQELEEFLGRYGPDLEGGIRSGGILCISYLQLRSKGASAHAGTHLRRADAIFQRLGAHTYRARVAEALPQFAAESSEAD